MVTTATSTGIPTTLPKAITPYTTTPAHPDGYTPIQIAFDYGFNYEWIVQQSMAAAQLFSLVPKAVAYDQNLTDSETIMDRIIPYDTTQQLGYITSLAILYIPSDAVEGLRLDHKIASSRLYTNTDGLVKNMTDQINPSIDIIYGSGLDGSSSTATDGSNPSSTGSSSNDAFGSSDSSSSQTSAQKGTTAAIAVGAFSVAGAYGAAMFVIARRYKRRKQRHQRSSSVSSPEMQQGGSRGSPALMGGALLSRDFTATHGNGNGNGNGAGNYGGVGGNMRDSQGSGRSGMNNSARTAFISAPVAAENSLGWN